jgi:hypothetical protein
MKRLIIIKYGVVIILLILVNLVNLNLSFGQDIRLIKTVVKKTDTLGDITHVYTLHGEFLINDLDIYEKTKWSKNKISQFYKIISKSEKKGELILIKYKEDRRDKAKYIVNVK